MALANQFLLSKDKYPTMIMLAFKAVSASSSVLHETGEYFKYHSHIKQCYLSSTFAHNRQQNGTKCIHTPDECGFIIGQISKQ